MAAAITTTGTMETWTEALGASRDRVLAAADTARHRAALLAHATAVGSWQRGRSIRRHAIRQPISK